MFHPPSTRPTNTTLSTLSSFALAGVLATLPMSAVVVLGRALAKNDRRRDPSPHEITEEALDQAPVPSPLRRLGHNLQPWTSTLAHFGFGAVAALPYALVRRSPSCNNGYHGSQGALYGAGIWAVSYIGWLPKLHLQPRVGNQPPSRNFHMIMAHLVWGYAVDHASRRLCARP